MSSDITPESLPPVPESSESSWRRATSVVHAGRTIDRETGAVVPPIHLSTTFARGPDAQLAGDFCYSRSGNPNRAELEQCVASLEGGSEAAAFASGSAAANAILQSLHPGDRVLSSRDLYHGVRSLMEKVTTRSGVACESIDLQDAAVVERELERGARVVWCETPANPQLHVIDLENLSLRCRAAGATLVVDNTFATPMLQRPLGNGAALVVHATTKYLAGHSDVTGGVVVTDDPASDLWQRIREVQTLAGSVPSPFDCWLALRGISTLHVRMKQHVENAVVLARRFEDHEVVGRVLFPGLESHPDHALASRQMSGPGGVLSIRLKAGEEGARRFTSRLTWIPRATSLGGVHTLVEHRMLVEPEGSPVPPDLVRISVGIEDAEDLWVEFDRALS